MPGKVSQRVFVADGICSAQIGWVQSLQSSHMTENNATLALSLHEEFIFGLDFSISSSILEIAILNLAIHSLMSPYNVCASLLNFLAVSLIEAAMGTIEKELSVGKSFRVW